MKEQTKKTPSNSSYFHMLLSSNEYTYYLKYTTDTYSILSMYNRCCHFLSRNKYYIRLWQGNSVLRSSNDHCKNNLIKHINLSISRVFFNIRYFICLIFKDKKKQQSIVCVLLIIILACTCIYTKW